jgi:ABC-type sulfate/molybdate transport systems ATPase subunit
MLELNLEARRGSFHLKLRTTFAAPWTVVFGPSGSGKTTLLRLIAGLDRPDSGQIRFDGKLLHDSATRVHLAPGKREVGLVAQQPALFPHLDVAANVAYCLNENEHFAKQTQVAEMLNLVGALPLFHRRPRELSGGEAQRVALARALAPLPRLLLLDEPLSALDSAARDEILFRLQAWLAAKEIQTILVTHDAADALATQAEVALLAQGRLTAQGPASEVLANERARLLSRLGVDPH